MGNKLGLKLGAFVGNKLGLAGIVCIALIPLDQFVKFDVVLLTVHFHALGLSYVFLFILVFLGIIHVLRVVCSLLGICLDLVVRVLGGFALIACTLGILFRIHHGG